MTIPPISPIHATTHPYNYPTVSCIFEYNMFLVQPKEVFNQRTAIKNKKLMAHVFHFFILVHHQSKPGEGI